MYDPPPEKQGYTISLFVDSKDSWIIPWVKKLARIISPYHRVKLCFEKDELLRGDFNFLLGCTKILEKRYLNMNPLNLVIHESDLPGGKGWSPMAWQILEGRSRIPVTLFEACEGLDAGPVYLKDVIVFQGHELLPEIKAKQGEKTVEMVIRFLDSWPELQARKQKGEETYYRKRTQKDDMLDIHRSIAEQFNNLRIVDNEKYPAWFELHGCKYKILIYKD